MGRIHLGSILGTTITLDFSFFILVAFFILSDVESSGMPYALLWAPVLFISVIVHELAHAGMIGLFGFGPSAIILGGIGGVTINERRGKPWQDMLISGVGPVSSFLLAFAVWSLPPMGDPFFRSLLPLLYSMNIILGFFNLLPVGPLDGASVLRNFLRLFLRDRTAFVISIWTSIVVGVLVGIYGLVGKWYFLTILMLWYVWRSWEQWQFFQTHNRPDD